MTKLRFYSAARLRIVGVNLREVNFALKAGDFAKARKALAAFSSKLSSVDGLLKARSLEASETVAKVTSELMSALKLDKPDSGETTSLMASVMEKYSAVMAEVTKDARSH